MKLNVPTPSGDCEVLAQFRFVNGRCQPERSMPTSCSPHSKMYPSNPNSKSHQPETRLKSLTCFLSSSLISTTDCRGSPYPNGNPDLTVPVASFPPPLCSNVTTSRLINLILALWLYECSKQMKHCTVKRTQKTPQKTYFEWKTKKIAPQIRTYSKPIALVRTSNYPSFTGSGDPD